MEIVLTIQELEQIVKEAKELQGMNPGMFTDAVAIERKGVSKKYGEADFARASLLPKTERRPAERVFKNY